MNVMEGVRGDWDTGRLSATEIAAEMADRLACTPGEAHAYMQELCQRIVFYPRIDAAVRNRRARGGRQALVTVNPDLFEEVVGNYSLLDVFDAVVTSAVHGTANKVMLCHRALAILGIDDPGEAVLIDNLAANINGWSAAGGQTYLFSSDGTFASDVVSGLVPGFEVGDLPPP
jgi:FMN phosphatase YigB (HAD superfamily)